VPMTIRAVAIVAPTPTRPTKNAHAISNQPTFDKEMLFMSTSITRNIEPCKPKDKRY